MNCRTLTLALAFVAGTGYYGIVRGDSADPTMSSTQLGQLSRQVEALTKEIRLLREELRELRRDGAVARRDETVAKPAAASLFQIRLQSDDPVLGSPGAPIALVEFTDYQCPYCGQFHRRVLPEIKARYVDTGKVRYIVRDYPLSFHSDAKDAVFKALGVQ